MPQIQEKDFCRFIREDGKRCHHRRTSPLGYCKKHADEFDRYFNLPILKCTNCMITETCKYVDSDKDGYCYFEQLETLEGPDTLSDKDLLLSEMKKVIKSELRMFRRMERLLSEEFEKSVQDQYNRLGRSIFEHMEHIGRFQGWSEPKIAVEEKRINKEILLKIFRKEEKHESGKEVEVQEDKLNRIFIKVPHSKERIKVDDDEET